MYRNSLRRCSIEKGVPKNFAKLKGKQLCRSLIFDEVSGLRHATLLKKDCSTGVFLCILENLKKIFFREQLWTTGFECNGLSGGS